jgi:DGQHR domain-containing protein
VEINGASRLVWEGQVAKGKGKKKLSPEEEIKKLQSDHKKMVRSVFRQTGFTRIPKLSDKEFAYKGQKTDFDDVYVYENILVLIEYTVTKSSGIGAHLKPKKIIYDKIEEDTAEFCEFYCQLSDDLAASLDNYHYKEVIIKIIYCSKNKIEASYKRNVPNPVYLDYPELRYFKNITDCIKKSARHELFHFLKIEPSEIGVSGKIGLSVPTEKYKGSLLPEAQSFFDEGFKVVSFYVDPEALLKRAYVLRKDGWRDSRSMYQRMISKPKIESIRRYLKKNKRVFVNNVIATLANDTKIVDEQGNTVDPKEIHKTQPVQVQIPDRINTAGIIDGQHRTYSYYESINDDPVIAKFRTKQNLLVTGIIYPPGMTETTREKFEARLFLEINSTQTNAKSNLKQAIGLVLEPFAAESIATGVMTALDSSGGPLDGQIERYWFDQNKLKSTSVVSFGLKPLVKTTGTDSIFALWSHPKKEEMVPNEDHELLNEYIKYCVAQIDMILAAAKNNVPKENWTTDKSVSGRMLTTTNINCLLICLRLLIENDKAKGFKFYDGRLKNISKFKFSDYHSSQYNKMALAIYEKHFTNS